MMVHSIVNNTIKGRLIPCNKAITMSGIWAENNADGKGASFHVMLQVIKEQQQPSLEKEQVNQQQK
jgi:hypothetical protein